MKGNLLLLFMAFWPMIGGLITYGIGRSDKEKRNYFADLVGIVEFAAAFLLFLLAAFGRTASFSWEGFCGYGLYLKLDGFRGLYGCVAALMWMMTTIFSRDYLKHYRNRNRYYLFTLITCGATEGVFLSADLFTTFIFFEIMSFTSYVMVIHDEKPGAMRAGETYLAVAVIGGMVMLMGLFLLYHQLGTLNMDGIFEASRQVQDKRGLYVAGFLIFLGFGAKAGMFPLHIWLPKAHPVAPAPASALLSGILTKVGIFGILVVSCNLFLHDASWGFLVLITGVITMFLGAVLAVFSVDLKRTLACSSMSQIGFILVGVGMQGLLAEENGLAVWGTVLHMVNHSLFKLVLFMVAGVVYMNLHQLNLNEIKGFGRNKPLLNLLFLAGYLGIIGMPLFSGYVSKTLLHESIVEYAHLLHAAGRSAALYTVIEWIFLISGGLTAAYMTKLYVCLFFDHNTRKEKHPAFASRRCMHVESFFAIGVPACLIPLFGVLPGIFMSGFGRMAQGFMRGEGPAHIAYFSLTNLKGAVISLGIGAFVYFFVIRKYLMTVDERGESVYLDRWPAKLDLENLVYRPLIQHLIPDFFGMCFAKLSSLVDDIIAAAPFVGAVIGRTAGSLPEWAMGLLHRSLLKKIPIPERDPKDFMPADTLPHGKEWGEAENMITSMSYGLILFGIGLIIAIFYVLEHQLH